MATIDIFNLSPRDFNLQMQEEAMYRTPAELDELRREYRNRNSMAGKLMGLLAPEEGKRRSTFLPVDAPQGMSIFDALRSGQATPAVPQGLVDLITGGTRGVESAREYAQGVPPRADALNDALAMSGLAMTGGGLAASTLRPTKPSLPSAPKERGDMILNMLKEGEAANITDDMFDMGDSVKTTQLNQYLFENYDLPMDAESRAQRLFQMGYRREGMHGTSKETAGTTETPDILAFRPSTAGAYGRGVYVDPVRDGDIGASRYYAEPRGREAGTSGTYYPLLTKGKLIEKGSYDDEYFKALDDVAKANPKESDQARATTEDAMNRLAEQRVSEQGFAGVGGAGEYTIFDPANIRSRSARADPRLAHLSDIMAANASKSAGLLTTAASEAQDMAKRILELRAEGRASEVTDEMMAQADPQYMFANTPLPMDEASRMARAEAAGFDVSNPVFHGGASGIKAMDADVSEGKDFDTGVWTTSDRYNANRYAGSRTEGAPKINDQQNWSIYDDRGSVYPLLAKTSGYGETNFRGRNWGDAPEGAIIRGGGQPSQRISEVREDWRAWPYTSEAVRAARDTGRSGLVIKDVVDIGPNFPYKDHIGLGSEISDDVVAIDPSTLRSRFARFDPEFAHLSNLSAANVSPLGGLLAQSGVSDKQAERIEEYLRRRGLLD
jgi:hypothetical protein